MPNRNASYLKLFIDFFKSERKDVFFIYFYSMISGLVYLSLPLGIQAIVGFAMAGQMSTSIYVIIAFVIFGTWIVGYLKILVMNIIEKIQQKIFVNYSIAFAEKFSKLDLVHSNQYYLPELVNRIFDTTNLQKGVTKILLEIPLATIRILFGIALLSVYHPWFMFFGMFVLLIVYVLYKLTFTVGIQSSIKESNNKYEVAYWLETIANSINSVKPYFVHNLHLNKVDEKLTEYVNNRTHHFKILKFQYKTIIGFKIIFTLIMLLLCSYLLINQKINLGVFIAAELVIMTIISSVEKLVISLESVYDVLISIYKLEKVLDLPDEQTGSIDFPKEHNGFSVDVNNLSFSYLDNVPVLKNINLSIKPNTITAISGKLTAGKSTLAKVIAGYYGHTDGMVLFDKIPTLNYNKNTLVSAVGYYADDQKVFSGSVFENIQLGNKEITIEKINTLADKLGISNIFHSFPNSYLTELSETTTQLTYSTKKAILLLKTFLGQHRLLIIEEPLLGMNEEFCKRFIPFITEMAKHKNIILISEDVNLQTLATHHFYMQEGQLKTVK